MTRRQKNALTTPFFAAMDAIMANLHDLHGELTARRALSSSPSPSPSPSPLADARARRRRRSPSSSDASPSVEVKRARGASSSASFARARAAIERECAALGEREAFEMRRARDLGALRADATTKETIKEMTKTTTTKTKGDVADAKRARVDAPAVGARRRLARSRA